LAKQDISSQMLKGILQGCLLIMLNEAPMYGYSISQKLAEFGFADVPKGTIYPLLMNMEKKKLVEGRMQDSKEGPKRKYYYLTAAGIQEMKNFMTQWRQLADGVNQLIAERRIDDDY
jgi:PadR family transcriptional regulator PadR